MDQDWNNFDPKAKQKAVYKWYDSRYSDEALDIYSKEWQQRILEWHGAYQLAIRDANESLTSDELLESLDFGKFFLAHPIAAFSLWRVLQACYELDRAVCGDTDEVTLWERMAPFKYLKDENIRLRWKTELGLLKDRMQLPSPNFRKESWKSKMYEILLGVERYETAFTSLKENFEINGEGKKFAPWMIERIEDGIEKRLAATELLRFKDSELATMHRTELHEDNTTGKTRREFDYLHKIRKC